MFAYVAIEIHVMQKNVYKPLFACQFAVAADNEIVNIRQNFVEVVEALAKSDDLLTQFVSSIVIVGFYFFVSRILGSWGGLSPS